jgi:Zn finger protein HypA/HybF involved in hydrogenase expression
VDPVRVKKTRQDKESGAPFRFYRNEKALAAKEMATAMPLCRSDPAARPAPQVPTCPQCQAELTVLRIIPGRAGAEYWTMRCTRCGGIHLDIVKGAAPS